MPSADITPARQFFFMHESQLRAWGPRPYWAGTYFLTVGLGQRTELAATLFDLGVSYDGGLGNTTLALGGKSAFRWLEHSHRSLELQTSVGVMALLSLVGRGNGVWAYALQSIVLPRTRTRLGAGFSFATEQLYGPQGAGLSAMLSIEQPLPIPRVRGLSFVAEWFSGTHDLANLIMGFTLHPNPTWIFVLGYKIPTRPSFSGVDGHALVFEIGGFLPRIGPRAPRRSRDEADEDDEHAGNDGHGA